MQGKKKDKEHEKELEEKLLGGWRLCFASESVGLKRQEDNHVGGTKQPLAIRGPVTLDQFLH